MNCQSRRGFVEKARRADGLEWLEITAAGREAIGAGPLR